MNPQLNNKKIIYWNRKLHIYIGLFLLFFILFFSLSGLLLNNGQWEFASFWKERKESEISSAVTIPEDMDSTALLQHFMKELKLSGEINNVKLTPESADFRIVKPGTNQDIHVDYKSATSIRKEMVFNWWGKIRILHTFNGSDKNNPDLQPNWFVTRIWRGTMDVLAIGMIFLCISSWIMWFIIRKNYPAGWIALMFGFAGAAYFIFLLRLF